MVELVISNDACIEVIEARGNQLLAVQTHGGGRDIWHSDVMNNV